jgi:TonB family protein
LLRGSRLNRPLLTAILLFVCGCSARAATPSSPARCADLNPAEFRRPSAERIDAARAALRAGNGLAGEFTPHTTEPLLSPAERRKLSRNLFSRVRNARQEGRMSTSQTTPARAVLLAGVRVDGSVEEISVLESSGLIVVDRIAVEALQEANFRPANLNGCPVPAWFALPLTLALD